MIGLSLVISGWDEEQADKIHLKNYIYFGMAFSFGVELLNMIMRKRIAKRRIVELNEPRLKEKEDDDYSDQAK
jgi:predicted tellurium resistance membrane protein TerC